MRRHLLYRTIMGATAATLLTSSAIVAQSDAQPPSDNRVPPIDTRIPPEQIASTDTAMVLTNALDGESTNARITETVGDYWVEIGGRDGEPTAGNKKKDKPAKGGITIEPPATDTEALSEALIQQARDLPDLVFISGSDGQTDATVAASAETSAIIDLSQPVPCITATGQADPSGECAGGSATLPFNYTAVDFAVEDAAYLAGVMAARLSRTSLGIIGGYQDCIECQRYIEGFINGARSVEPDIPIDIAYLADNEIDGFSDAANARTFTSAFIDIYQPDVILPVGRAASLGMIEAACDADVWAVGTGTDVRAEHPDLDCVVASITKDLPRAITEAMWLFAGGETMRVMEYDLANDGVALTDDGWRDRVPVDTGGLYQEAERQIRSGEVEACPGGCSSLPAGG